MLPPDGHRLLLRAMNEYRLLRNDKHRFVGLVKALKKAQTVEQQLGYMYLINALVNIHLKWFLQNRNVLIVIVFSFCDGYQSMCRSILQPTLIFVLLFVQNSCVLVLRTLFRDSNNKAILSSNCSSMCSKKK